MNALAAELARRRYLKVDPDNRPVADALEADWMIGCVRSDAFRDPATYSAEREVTVYGVLENVLMRNIGEHPYTYPSVQAIQLYLRPSSVTTETVLGTASFTLVSGRRWFMRRHSHARMVAQGLAFMFRPHTRCDPDG